MSERTTGHTDRQIAAVSVEFDIEVAMRDGTALRADIYRPVQRGPWPVLLARTPYGKQVQLENQWNGISPVEAARQGFIVVIQDTRGRGASDGDWRPLLCEADDGVDTIEWASELDDSNGRVGMFGGSYCGNTQWQPAIAGTAPLRAIAPAMTWSEPDDGLFSRGGAIELGLALYWSLLTGADDVHSDAPSDESVCKLRQDAILDEIDALAERGYWELPAADAPPLKRHRITDLGTFTADPRQQALTRVRGHEHRIEIATFHTAGWYDLFLQGILDNFQACRDCGHDNRLVVGPWTHLNFADPIGDLTFGVRSARDTAAIHHGLTWEQSQLRWFRTQLDTTEPTDLCDDDRVHIFVMGINQWRSEPTWPPDRTVRTKWYLRGGGELSPKGSDAGSGIEQFRYDPANPVPTVGGNILLSPEYPAGPRDQRVIENRHDVLCFTSAPLDEDLEVTGRVTVTLCAKSSAVSTDWVARLCDVYPDGRSINICDGIDRVTERANKLSRNVIDLWSTSIVFRRGHRIRLQVTSSSFPRWDRNFNTGRQRSAHSAVSLQQVFTNDRHASYVELPTIPTDAGTADSRPQQPSSARQ